MQQNVIIVCLIMTSLGIWWGFSLIKIISTKEDRKKGLGLLTILITGVLLCTNFLNKIGYQDNILYPIFCLTSSSIISTLLIFFNFKQSNPNISLYSFVFHLQKELDNYEEKLKEKLKNELNIDKLEKKHKYLKEKELQLDEINKQNNIQKETIEKEKETIEKLKKDHQCIIIPIKKRILITDELISSFPIWFRRTTIFYENINIECEQTVLHIKNRPEEEIYNQIVAFFKLICISFCEHFFHNDEARMHFRILRNDQYESFVSATCENKKNNIYLPTNFAKNNGVFKHLNKEKRAIVKSKNLSIFSPGSNQKWEDYLSGTSDKYLNEQKETTITFGISIKHSKKHSNLLYFLSFIQIEELIFAIISNFENKIKESIDNKINIIEVLKNGNNK